LGKRRSAHTDRALSLARKLTPEGIEFCACVMRDATIDVRSRLKATEIILHHGLPDKGSAGRRDIIGEGIQSLRVEFVRADGSTVSFNDQAPPAIIEVPWQVETVAKCDGTVTDAVGAEEKT